MALGDINVYPAFKLATMKGDVSIDFDSDLIKVAVMSSVGSYDPGTNFATDNNWDDVSANQVGTAGGYTGPITLTTLTTSQNGNDAEFLADDVTIPQNASGFTDGRWIMLFYDSTVASTSTLIGYGDLGADQSIATANYTLNWGTAIFRW